MDENKFNQAKINFNKYLADELLTKTKFNQNIFNKFEQNSIESLEVANKLLNNKTSSLWVIVSSYYAMFYIASAYVYKKGYKTQGIIVHKVMVDTLIHLAKNDLTKKMIEDYEEEKDKALSIAETLLDSFELERGKRGRIQYNMTEEVKEAKARTSLKRAKDFVNVFRTLIEQ